MKLQKPSNSQSEDVLLNLLKSNLMSGGMENKFLNFFSINTVEAIKQVAVIEKDKTLLNYVTKEKFSDQDNLLLEILEKGKNKQVDQLIDFFQWELVRRHIWSRTGGEEGMKVTR